MEQHLVDKACEIFNMTLPDFARHIDFPKSTLQTWKDNGKCSRRGEVMLNTLIENHHLKQKDEATKRFLELYGLKKT